METEQRLEGRSQGRPGATSGWKRPGRTLLLNFQRACGSEELGLLASRAEREHISVSFASRHQARGNCYSSYRKLIHRVFSFPEESLSDSEGPLHVLEKE